MENDIKEISLLIDSIYEFYEKTGDKILNKEQLKESNSIRNKLKKKLSFLFESYQPSTGGFATTVYRFIFYNKTDIDQFSKIINYSKYYSNFNVQSMGENVYRVNLLSNK